MLKKRPSVPSPELPSRVMCIKDILSTMNTEDVKKGTFVRPVWIETTGNLVPLFDKLTFATKGPAHTQKRLRVFVSIMKAASEDPDNLVYWISNREKYAHAKYDVAHSVFKNVVDQLIALNWMSVPKGQKPKDGLARRYRVAKKIVNEIKGLELEWENLKPEREPKRRNDLIIVKPRELERFLKMKGYNLPPRGFDEDDLNLLRIQVEDLNSYALQHTFEGLSNRLGEYRNFRGFSRTFNHTLHWGGRMYGGCEQMPESERLKIKIDGESVCEIDITACQPTILSSRNVVPVAYEETSIVPDYYDLVVKKLNGLLDREEVKSVVTKALGNGYLPKRNWPKDIRKEGYRWSEIVAAFLEAMPFLELLEPLKEDTFTLQYSEAAIIYDTVYNLYKYKNIPTLPVHDSLVTPTKFQDIVMRSLSSTFWVKTGARPRLTIKAN